MKRLDGKSYLTTGEAAQMLGLTVTRVHQLIKKGTLVCLPSSMRNKTRGFLIEEDTVHALQQRRQNKGSIKRCMRRSKEKMAVSTRDVFTTDAAPKAVVDVHPRPDMIERITAYAPASAIPEQWVPSRSDIIERITAAFLTQRE